MSGRPRKTPNALAGHRASKPPLALVAPTAPPPPAPAGLESESVIIWDRYWRSAVSSRVDREGDIGAVERWIWYLDELARARRAYRRKRIVAGSTGQPAVNPIFRTITSLEAMIRGLEAELGMTPLARRRMGYDLGKPAGGGGKREAIDELNAELDDEDDQGAGPLDFDQE